MEDSLMWLSFCDDKKPEGSQFLGVLIAPGDNIVEATLLAHHNGLNPGGEVLGVCLPDDKLREYVGRLLSRDEAITLAARLDKEKNA